MAAVVAGALVLRYFFGAYYIDAFITIVLLLGLYELIKLFKNDMTPAAVAVILLYGISIYPSFKFLGGMTGVFLISIAFFVLINIVLLFDGKATQRTVTDFIFMMFYPTMLIGLAYPVNNHALGFWLLLVIIAVSVLTDTMAYFTGITIGGKKLCPSISPKKTIAGAVGGLVGGLVAALAVWGIMLPHASFQLALSDVWVLVILGIVGSVMNQLGDLVASNLKRKYEIKDFGSLIPGHGGLVDRIDGVMFNIIAVFAFTVIFLA